MNIHQMAELKSAAEFRSAYKGSDRDVLERGTSLVYKALLNTSLPDRYQIANFLLDQGCPSGASGPGGATVLHVLFGQVKHDIHEDANLARRLIEAGADINALDNNRRLPFLEVLNMNFQDDELQPIYDVWLERPDADFTTESVHGLSPISGAAKLPFRAGILKQMERYVTQHS